MKGTAVKTSIRLALTALAVGGVTFAASGKPLPFLAPAHETTAVLAAPLPPASPDGAAPDMAREPGPALSRLQ